MLHALAVRKKKRGVWHECKFSAFFQLQPAAQNLAMPFFYGSRDVLASSE